MEETLTPKEPTFTLRAQDITADLIVEVWADVNKLLDIYRRRGYSIEDAMGRIAKCFQPLRQELIPQPIAPKIAEAYVISKAMGQWHTRKVAD